MCQITLKSLSDSPKDSDQAGVCACGVTLQRSDAEIGQVEEKVTDLRDVCKSSYSTNAS